ncbi:type I restriction enzyme HsdR N-terminal domain-containing protein [Algisphaera agarilytica]|uniref:Type I restriction enzyme R protein N-terminal domain-containing protein n=1 Tax=Algisphaera agarilytica TaxID=1385975 RepID=A0A7X0H9G7_9BACT|nr:type I restriction enzyme HsdR N-terminal domain-containing protein [Algisphaera agarilytica]MBB6430596.1 hypothetical protein [Algisphaera agarilytica]
MAKKRTKKKTTSKRKNVELFVQTVQEREIPEGTPNAALIEAAPLIGEDPSKEGYITDFISGKSVRDTPEEREAVQVFSMALVQDYGYPKSHIQTRPQHRVRKKPSDKSGKYPVDIAVFGTEDRKDDEAYIIVECKKKNRKDGQNQLEDYLRFSAARLGVWFNGEERLFLEKIEGQGKVTFRELPNIPRYG